MRPRALLLTVGLLAASAVAAAPPNPERRNVYGDPFFALVADDPGCPLPAGPFITAAEQRAEAHHRAEKGTSCWLAGRCATPNADAGDVALGAAVQAALAAQAPRWAGASLWVTVQAAVVVVEGCTDDPALPPALEAAAVAVPGVQRAIAILRTERDAPPPYRTRSAP